MVVEVDGGIVSSVCTGEDELMPRLDDGVECMMLRDEIVMTLQQVKKSALKLPLPSRMKLMTALAKSFEVEVLHGCPPGVLSDSDPNFMEILHSRLEAYERGEVKTIPWEKVKKRLSRRRT